MLEPCIAPSNDIRQAAFAAGVDFIWKATKGENVKEQIDAMYDSGEQSSRMVRPEYIRGRENPDGSFDPPRCDGQLHLYHRFSPFYSRWERCATPCPMWKREQADLKSAPAKTRKEIF